MTEIKIQDASEAEAVVRRQMEAKYSEKLKNLIFRKAWYSSAGEKEFWEIEGAVVTKRGILSKQTRNFRYQIDPNSGRIIGYDEVTRLGD